MEGNLRLKIFWARLIVVSEAGQFSNYKCIFGESI